MAQVFDFTRLRRLTIIHVFVQAFLLILLVGTSSVLLGKVPSQVFMNSVIRVVVLQLILFYPVYKLAASDAEREVASAATGLAADEMQALRRKRVFSDILKGALIIFFFTFILRAPGAPQIQFSILAVFLLSYLAYFQCFNSVAKRLMRAKS
ncbi:hypothetical protein [Geobacter anodireducens]|uniref:Uncharacterized protein n=1 Tax=Geobacter anodireducens TaxID=1340425 RepID=A0ABR9NQG9_9BACT|nr:hypothetical protein [Geobacter anodireducens]MBE2886506.1 hypothetical protein [Geobacter anodireducens]